MKNNLPQFKGIQIITMLTILCTTIIILNKTTVTNKGELHLCIWQEHTCLKIKGK